MARAPRLNFPDAVYHVTSRWNGRARIVCADADRARFLRQLEDNIATHAVRLREYVPHLPRGGVVIGHTSMRASWKTTNSCWKRCVPADTPLRTLKGRESLP